MRRNSSMICRRRKKEAPNRSAPDERSAPPERSTGALRTNRGAPDYRSAPPERSAGALRTIGALHRSAPDGRKIMEKAQ